MEDTPPLHAVRARIAMMETVNSVYDWRLGTVIAATAIREFFSMARKAASSLMGALLAVARDVLAGGATVGAFVVAASVIALLPPAHLLSYVPEANRYSVLMGLAILATAEILLGIVGFLRSTRK